VLALDVIEHVDDDMGILVSLFDVMKPGGHLIVTVPAFDALWSEHDEINHHKRRYRSPQIRHLMEEAGFEVERVSYCNTALYLPVLLTRKAKNAWRTVAHRRSTEPRALQSDLGDYPKPVNDLLFALMRAETRLMDRMDMPFGVSILAEERVDFRRELSALVARSPSGQVAAYPVVESVQQDGVCFEVTAPAPDLDPQLSVEAQRIAMRVAGELDVTGILAVELFETRDGRVLVNELAMRPHNTGHWSMDGAVTGQFENHLRAVLDLPLGAPEARAPWTVMVNILGGGHGALSENLYAGYPHVFARDPRLKVHLYGKDVKPGRKVGHVTAYGEDLDDVRMRARHAAAWFRGDLGDESE
jgi:hypothetical protein